MTDNIDFKLQTIKINGKVYTHREILGKDISETNYSFTEDLLAFLKEWFNESKYISVQTSGSTGAPHVMQVEKSKMLHSAKTTCDFLGLKKNDSALLCMNLKYIGAKMVVVRSIYAGLNLITTESLGNPLSEVEATDFAAMTPLQVFNTLQNQEQKKKLRQIRHLIIGGGAVDDYLLKELFDFPHAIWSTYGMTETLSHIALRKINGSDHSDWYTPFEDIQISLSEKQTLVINAPKLTTTQLITNDIAKINSEGKFRILGRLDNVINSGGVKIQIEEVEHILRKEITCDFMITSLNDKKFGEIVVMLIKQGTYSPNTLEIIFQQKLPKYWIPKKIFFIENLPFTETNKPDRSCAKQIANQLKSEENKS